MYVIKINLNAITNYEKSVDIVTYLSEKQLWVKVGEYKSINTVNDIVRSYVKTNPYKLSQHVYGENIITYGMISDFSVGCYTPFIKVTKISTTQYIITKLINFFTINNNMKYQGNNELGQEVFHNQPPEVNWAGVDYDGELNFGISINPRYTWASERWRGFKQIGESVENSGYKPLTQITRI
jgi:hypothetical protein